MTPRNRLPRRRSGFTLVELLTVIGIIILLIGILLPVMSSIRRGAWAVDSQSLIMNLASAVERYRQDFSAYPGPIGNGTTAAPEFNTANGTNATRGGMTMSENLVLGLLGGWEPGATPPSTSAFAAAQVGNGPMTHNPLATARKRYAPYFDASFGNNVQAQQPGAAGWASTVMTAAESTYASADSSSIPEFIDRFPDPMPILYLRARTGAPSFTSGGALDATTQYNPAHLYPYVKGNNAAGFPGRSEDVNNNGSLDSGEDTNGNGRLDFDFSADGGSTGSAAVYFRNPGVTSEVRQKDGFWLIGAGPDRKFGTKDDQTNFGPIQ